MNEFAVKPPAKCFEVALKYKAVSYQRVTQALNQMRGCLAAGYPFVFGFTVYESFESAAVAKSGVVPMPKPEEGTLGGHAVMAVRLRGREPAVHRSQFMGGELGEKGYFMMPYAYLSNRDLASDLWTIRLMLGLMRAAKLGVVRALGRGKRGRHG